MPTDPIRYYNRRTRTLETEGADDASVVNPGNSAAAPGIVTRKTDAKMSAPEMTWLAGLVHGINDAGFNVRATSAASNITTRQTVVGVWP